MALEGTIKEFGLADIFQLIGLQKKTGILFLKGEEETVNIHFEDGMVVKTDESKKKPRYLLGRILVNRDKVTEAQLSECLDIQKSTGQKLGGVMISQGLINKDELRDVLNFQINEAVYKVFRWRSGDYKFDQERVDYDRDTITPISTEHVLMDGIRMLDEWPQIDSKLPDMAVVLKKSESCENMLAQAEDSDDIFAGFDTKLSSDSKHLIGLIDGKKSIYEVIEFSRLGEFDTCKTLVDLINQRLIVTSDAKPELLTDLSYTPESAALQPPKAGILDKLVYLFVVIAIVAIYSQLTGTREIMNPSITRLEDLKRPYATSVVKKAGEAVTGYYFELGSYPESVEALEQLDFMSSDELVDPWGNRLVLEKDSAGDTSVISPGPDGQLHTDDDISSLART